MTTGASPDVLIPPDLDATLVMLRHGETTFILEDRFQGRQPAALSPLGERQALLAAGRLAHPAEPPALPIPPGPPLAIVHSPLLRTTQVAEIVAAAYHEVAGEAGPEPPLRPAEALLEIDQGAWEGLRHDEIRERFGAELSAWRHDPVRHHAPGGESLPEVQARVRSGLRPLLEELAAAGSPGTLDRSHVFGYAGVGSEMPPWALLVGHDGDFKVVLLTLIGLPLARFWSFPFALCGISVVDIRGGRAALRAHNLVEHLAPLEAGLPAARRSPPESDRREASGAL